MATDIPTMAFKAFYDYVSRPVGVFLYGSFFISWFARLFFLYHIIITYSNEID